MTNEESAFIERHNLSPDWMHNALGSPMTQELKAEMKELEKLFAYNAAPCNAGHTLKSRKGHCIVCDTSDIAFYLRHYKSGFVYIAASLTAKRVKIGSTNDIKNRESNLNSEKGYANFNDWRILCFIHTLNVGRHEVAIHSKLSAYQEPPIEYRKGATYQMATEIFRCSYKKAYDIFHSHFSEISENIKTHSKDFEKYKFPNLARP